MTASVEHSFTIQVNKDQMDYLESRREQIQRDTGIAVSRSHVVREAVELLREHKPVHNEPAQVAS